MAAQDDSGGTRVEHWSRDPLLQRRVLLGSLVTVAMLGWTPPVLLLITLAMVVWPLGVLEASSVLRLRRVRALARVTA